MGIAGRKFGYRGKIKRCSFVISNTEGTYDRRPRTWKCSMASPRRREKYLPIHCRSERKFGDGGV
jgi:hypothetical protein